MREFIMNHTGWFVFICIIVVLIIILLILIAYAFRYFLTEEDRKHVLLGDDYIDGSKETRLDPGGLAITINAPVGTVWQHMKQFGQDRAGWYSFELLERIFTFDIHNHYTIHPEWQELKPGRFLFYHQPPWGLGSLVTQVDEERHMFASISDSRLEPVVEGSIYFVPPFKLKHFCWTWNFAAFDLGDETTRYMFTAQATCEPVSKLRIAMLAAGLGLPSLIMGSRHMKVLKKVCEGTMKISAKHV